tara:strand:+ start:402 stop:716 length:315 start_codon:yes stop_codon:yes gene_type:complete
MYWYKVICSKAHDKAKKQPLDVTFYIFAPTLNKAWEKHNLLGGIKKHRVPLFLGRLEENESNNLENIIKLDSRTNIENAKKRGYFPGINPTKMIQIFPFQFSYS